MKNCAQPLAQFNLSQYAGKDFSLLRMTQFADSFRSFKALWREPNTFVGDTVLIFQNCGERGYDEGGWDSGQGLSVFRTENPTLKVGFLRAIDTTLIPLFRGVKVGITY
jgi:hypothetical protein